MKTDIPLKKEDSRIIDALGGTGAVAKIFGVSDPTVSIWRRIGIPKARRMYLEVVYPHLFGNPTPTEISTKVNAVYA
ncbi:MAG: hypothetical protein WA071_13895 [Undibacterium umbellatum]|uniref:hypothetical protein n=1 Tax=Undibacterium umbellatum TaxID=2762300 RepID=UPI003BB670C4